MDPNGSPGPAEPGLDDTVAFLRQRVGPMPPDEPMVPDDEVETHMSWVFLRGDRAYKLKKPVVHSFLDYRTVEARRRDCEAEVAVNQALAPGVYLGTEAVSVDDRGRLHLGREGTVVDWLVVMTRLDRRALLDHRIEQGEVAPADLDPVIGALVEFYRTAARHPVEPERYVADLVAGVHADLADLGDDRFDVDRDGLDELGGALRSRLTGTGELAGRAARLVDGHGDLRPEHVRPGPPPLIIDRISFDAALRRVDPAYDLALLAVECERLGAPELGRRVLEGYRHRSGDPVSAALLDLYGAVRAITRARLAVAHLDDGGSDAERWIERTERYLDVAAVHLGGPAGVSGSVRDRTGG